MRPGTIACAHCHGHSIHAAVWASRWRSAIPSGHRGIARHRGRSSPGLPRLWHAVQWRICRRRCLLRDLGIPDHRHSAARTFDDRSSVDSWVLWQAGAANTARVGFGRGHDGRRGVLLPRIPHRQRRRRRCEMDCCLRSQHSLRICRHRLLRIPTATFTAATHVVAGRGRTVLRGLARRVSSVGVNRRRHPPQARRSRRRSSPSSPHPSPGPSFKQQQIPPGRTSPPLPAPANLVSGHSIAVLGPAIIRKLKPRWAAEGLASCGLAGIAGSALLLNSSTPYPGRGDRVAGSRHRASDRRRLHRYQNVRGTVFVASADAMVWCAVVLAIPVALADPHHRRTVRHAPYERMADDRAAAAHNSGVRAQLPMGGKPSSPRPIAHCETGTEPCGRCCADCHHHCASASVHRPQRGHTKLIRQS